MQQNQMQNQNWPGMHMGFNQNNSNDGFPPHQNNQQPQQQHKPTGKFWKLMKIIEFGF